MWEGIIDKSLSDTNWTKCWEKLWTLGTLKYTRLKETKIHSPKWFESLRMFRKTMGPYIKEWVSEITGSKRKQLSFKNEKNFVPFCEQNGVVGSFALSRGRSKTNPEPNLLQWCHLFLAISAAPVCTPVLNLHTFALLFSLIYKCWHSSGFVF